MDRYLHSLKVELYIGRYLHSLMVELYIGRYLHNLIFRLDLGKSGNKNKGKKWRWPGMRK